MDFYNIKFNEDNTEYIIPCELKYKISRLQKYLLLPKILSFLMLKNISNKLENIIKKRIYCINDIIVNQEKEFNHNQNKYNKKLKQLKSNFFKGDPETIIQIVSTAAQDNIISKVIIDFLKDEQFKCTIPLTSCFVNI